MKNAFLLLTALVLFPSMAVCQHDSSWFSVKEVAKDVWQIIDRGPNIYLIIGRDSALVVDTGNGAADLAGQIRKMTDKPLIVLNTHGHGDHTGANYQFEKVYVHEADLEAAAASGTSERAKSILENLPETEKPQTGEQFKGKPFNTKLILVTDGDLFNLGDRWLRVMETPGHTPGSICLLDISNKLLFSGDNNNGLVWLWLPGCLPLSKYLATLEKQVEWMSEFTTIFPGHGDPMPAEFILDQVTCVKSILDGTCQSKPYEHNAGNARVCASGKASVAFNPENL
jgi:glyoxylase-like metal-dependent hydrolase (beta-lactamase superfamily II)